MPIVIKESFSIPKKTPDDIYFSLKVWMTWNNAYLHEDSTIEFPKLVLESKQSGGLSYSRRLYTRRVEGFFSLSFDEQVETTTMNVTIESLIDSDLLTSEDAIKGSLFSRLESFLKFLKTPIKPELYGKYYSKQYIQNQKWETRLIFFSMTLLFSIMYIIFLYPIPNLNDRADILISFFLILPMGLLGIALTTSERKWDERRYSN